MKTQSVFNYDVITFLPFPNVRNMNLYQLKSLMSNEWIPDAHLPLFLTVIKLIVIINIQS